jgi:hypothetical protein
VTRYQFSDLGPPRKTETLTKIDIANTKQRPMCRTVVVAGRLRGILGRKRQFSDARRAGNSSLYSAQPPRRRSSHFNLRPRAFRAAPISAAFGSRKICNEV